MNIGLKDFLYKFRRPVIVMAHLGFVCTAYFLAFLVRFDFSLTHEFFPVFIKTLPLLIAIKLTVFYFFDLYVGLWRYVGMADLVQIVRASAVASLIFLVIQVFISGVTGFPRSIFLLDLLIFIALVSGVRLVTRLLRERYRRMALPRRQVKVLIVGAGDTGVLLLKQFRNYPSMGEVVGFIDDDRGKRGETIQGIRILGGRGKIAQVIEEYGVEEVILAMPSTKGETVRDILARCDVPGVRIKIVPDLDKIMNGALEIKPRQVDVEDLLGREPVVTDHTDVENCIRGRRVLVTGAGGSIGSELCRQIAQYAPEKIILLDHNENDVYFLELEFRVRFPDIKFRTLIGDIRDAGLLRHVFSTFEPAVVFHAAAHKHVPLMEGNPGAAVKNNIIGTRNLVYAAAHYQVDRFVLISTDKAVNPTSIMGATKRIAEMILQAKAKQSRTKFMAVRFGNVLGSSGSVIPLFKKQIEAGGPVTVTHPEVRRYFMSIPEAAALVIQAGVMGHGGEIFILDMGEPIRIVDLARNLITLSGFVPDKDIPIVFTGLRPGEKLYEEILHDKERDGVTRNEKIYISRSDAFDPAQLRRKVREMERAVKLGDDVQTIRLIEEMVPIQRPLQDKDGMADT